MKINGSWFEFQHGGGWEAKYWNPQFMQFSAEQWKTLIKDIAGIGMEYLVLMSSALGGKTFYESEYAEEYPIACRNLLPLLLETAEKLDLKVFVANDFFGDWSNPVAMMTDSNIREARDRRSAEIVERFGHYRSFYGWYWPNEAAIHPYYEEFFIDYVNHNSALAHQLTPGKKTLIAPYGTFRAKTDDAFIDQLERLDIDYIAYQDEIGVRKSNLDWTPYYFEALRRAHDKAGRSKLWADVEVFHFEGEVYKTALLPAPFERVKAQIDGISQFVDRILIYQSPGLMSRPGSIASTGTASEQLYTAYAEHLKRQG
ncbi:DUF4434 domain-containing protein [Victivallis sp. Marseille-Q1083]|uniref:DUF4434 domain-containing protein n=1 Tax=Victivallis sp. Marseille-Q1083 TaxID=2717288 RepID=UPI00158D906B|nr:DUF4434 domain-containing protein [Victivallis sp. Marseille-Q1083]